MLSEFRNDCLADAYEIDRASDDEDDDEEDMELDGADASGNEAGVGNVTAGAPGVITTDFFRQAMMMATGGTANLPAPLATQVLYFHIFMNLVCTHHSFEPMATHTRTHMCVLLVSLCCSVFC